MARLPDNSPFNFRSRSFCVVEVQRTVTAGGRIVNGQVGGGSAVEVSSVSEFLEVCVVCGSKEEDVDCSIADEIRSNLSLFGKVGNGR